MQRAWPILVAALCAGCLRSTQFKCDADADCGAGRCEAAGFCSVPDSTCAGSMQRFSDSAGPLAGTCVEPAGGGRVDAGIDAPDPVENCPSTYAPIANGTPGHRYRRVTPPKKWDEQVANCTEPGARRTYLGVPDDATELAAMVALNGSNKLWLGIDDRATEGVFINANGAVQVFLPWKQDSPDPSADNDKDCVVAESDLEIKDDTCDAKYEAVCECEE